jgi:hypothetical protein
VHQLLRSACLFIPTSGSPLQAQAMTRKDLEPL